MTGIRLYEVDLVPERTLGVPADDAPLRGRLTFGWDVLPADHEGAPAEWPAYARSTPDREFRRLLMVCSFRPEPPETSEAPTGRGAFRHASLGLFLSTPTPGRHPVARLIDPGERTRPVAGFGTGMSLTVNTGLLDVGVERPPDAGPAKEEWIVRGHGASQPNPQWEFRRLKHFPLAGDHPVTALVELVPNEVNTAEVLMAAELEHRAWGVRRYRARFTSTPQAIVLSGGPGTDGPR